MKTIEPGQTFGRYRIEAVLGRGGMGQVLRAVDTVLERPVAIKLILPEREGRTEALARFFREAKLAAQIRHPNTVEIYDLGEHEGVPFIAMELLDGQPLSKYVGDGAIPLSRKLRWLLDVAKGLSAAHKRGLIHRDVKPQNVMVTVDDLAKVVDFGLAKQQVGNGQKLTMRGDALGTPAYMAPEQLDPDATVDARADQFAWALTAYTLITGKNPRGFDLFFLDPVARVDKRAPEVPEPIAMLIERAMAKDAAKRFATMADLVSELGHGLRSSVPSLRAAPRARPKARPKAAVFYCPACASPFGDSGICEGCGRALASAEKSTTAPRQPPPEERPAPQGEVARDQEDWTVEVTSTGAAIDRASINGFDQVVALCEGRLHRLEDKRLRPLEVPKWLARSSIHRVSMRSDGSIVVAGEAVAACLREGQRPDVWETPADAVLRCIESYKTDWGRRLVFAGARRAAGILLTTAGVNVQTYALPFAPEAMSLVSSDTLLLAGAHGAIALLKHQVSLMDPLTHVTWRAAAHFRGNVALLVGDEGKVLRVDGAGPAFESMPTTDRLTTITVSQQQVWAGTETGLLFRRRHDGVWSRWPHAELGAAIVAIRAIRRSVMAISADGKVLFATNK